MKISVLIIAHNEEAHIAECLDSIMGQTIQADEIVLIAHNCTDMTLEIARQYQKVAIYELTTEETWPLYARKYGFEKVSGDIVACIDGDSYATEGWLSSLLAPLRDPRVVAVAWYAILIASPIVSHLWFLLWLPLVRDVFDFYFWWSSFACRTSVYQKVGGFGRCREVAKDLRLFYPSEDCILSFAMKPYGKISFARNAKSYVYPGKFFDETDRGKKQREDFLKIQAYFRRNNWVI